jgi:hypothetical protein
MVYESIIAGMKDWSGKKNPNWKGGVHRRSDGYIFVTVDGKYRLEHRVVMEKKLGRKLKVSEIVHHKNGDNTDNRIKNLEVMSQVEHARHHMLINNPFKGKKHSKELMAQIIKSRAWFKPSKDQVKRQTASVKKFWEEHPDARIKASKMFKKMAIGRKRNSEGRFI